MTFVIILSFAERAIERDPNDVVAIAAAGEVGAETAADRGGIVPGIRG